MADIYPTGTCFTDAVNILHRRLIEEPFAFERYVLVHALIRDEEHTVHSHSWVECLSDELVYTMGIMNGERIEVQVPKDRYYLFVSAHDITRYTVEEAAMMQRAKNHPPPWEARYRERCAGFSRASA